METAFQNRKEAIAYLSKIRGGIPLGAEQTKLLVEIISFFSVDPKKAVDLGCGDGILAEVLLKMFDDIEVVCIDHSGVMLEKAKERLALYKDRVRYVEQDLTDSKIDQYLSSSDIVLSGYAIHHLPNEEKYSLYHKIYENLNIEGLFLNTEHVAANSKKIEQLHDKLFVDFLSDYRREDREKIQKEYDNREDKFDNILEKVSVQLDWLTEIGYTHVDCYFKWMELAIFGGVKSHN